MLQTADCVSWYNRWAYILYERTMVAALLSYQKKYLVCVRENVIDHIFFDDPGTYKLK